MDNQCIREEFIFKNKSYYCSLELALEIIGGKWKTLILYHLKDGALRSADLQRKVNGISTKMFAQTIYELHESGLINRTIVHN